MRAAPSDLFEDPGLGVVLLEPARADLVPQAMQRHVARLDRGAHEGEGHQVLEAGDHPLLLERLDLRFLWQLLHLFIGRAQQVQPGADEGGLFLEFGGVAGAHRMAAVHAAALRMAEHDHVGDLERGHRIFDRRRGAVVVAVGVVGRHQIRNVAVAEELARVGAEDRGHMDPRVAAGDDHRARALALVGEASVPGAVFRVGGRLPAMVAADQIRGQRPNVFLHRHPH
ncbi:hypothetical protein SDC9_34453 [bioreactor metagenome]|uniref:Uncharacterized protein n=1 Tax=bioreactor metagenome TaxID=1076179 RepID=A0A644VAW6_9ZZZZ